MLAGTYNVDTSTSKMEFKFTSSGQTGAYDQIVQYKETESPGLYNLAFGNLQPDGEIDDSVRTNNGDRDKILSTVAFACLNTTVTRIATVAEGHGIVAINVDGGVYVVVSNDDSIK